jgi:hypothetical protein
MVHAQWWVKTMGLSILANDTARMESLQARFALQSEEYCWVRSAQQKLFALQTSKQRYENNTAARWMGRDAEAQVVRYLETKGWEVLVWPSPDLRPTYGASTIGYDIVAKHGHGQELKIEVKYLDPTAPRVWMSNKCYESVRKISDIVALVSGDVILWSFTQDLVVQGQVYALGSEKYPVNRKNVILKVLDKGTFKVTRMTED